MGGKVSNSRLAQPLGCSEVEGSPQLLVWNSLPRSFTLEHSGGIWRLLCAA